MNGKNAFIIIMLYVASSLVFAEECKLKGSNLAKYAYKNGFTFSFNAKDSASCQLSSHKAGGSAATNDEGICIFELFLNKKLTPPWSFSHSSYAGKNFNIIVTPSKGDTSLYTKVKLSPARNGTATFLITEIIIKGGDCDNWKSAF